MVESFETRVCHLCVFCNVIVQEHALSVKLTPCCDCFSFLYRNDEYSVGNITATKIITALFA